MTIEIYPSEVSGAIAAPTSKSYAQRAIAAALLARGESTLRSMELSGDTAAALRVAQALGAQVEEAEVPGAEEGPASACRSQDRQVRETVGERLRSTGGGIVSSWVAGAKEESARVEPSKASSPTRAGSSREAWCRSAEGGNSAALRPQLAGPPSQPAAVGAAGGGGTYRITGGLNPRSATVDIGESGLSTRLFTPIAALCDRQITVTGHGSILSRPVSMMEAPLRELGVTVTTNGGLLPITVRGPLRGGVVHADGALSSQFITGLLMAAPLAGSDTFIRVESLNSRPYIDMTLEVMHAFGVAAENRDYREFFIPAGQSYTAADYTVEGDWSGASTLLVAGATCGSSGGITITNLDPSSSQADAAILAALRLAGAIVETGVEGGQVRETVGERLRSTGQRPGRDERFPNLPPPPNPKATGWVTVRRGEVRAFEFDATQCPDLFPALVALAASCRGTTTLRGTERLTHKESDRAATLAAEFGKLGIRVDISQRDVMKVHGGPMRGAQVDSHNDHRIAMALAVAALGASDGPTTITGAESVDKSYPAFWEALESIRR